MPAASDFLRRLTRGLCSPVLCPRQRRTLLHRTWVGLTCLAMALVSPVPQVRAQVAGYTTVSDDTPIDQTGFTSAGDIAGTMVIGNDGGTYILLQKMVGDGVGFTTGYQRIGVRAKIADFDTSHVWGEGVVLITDDTQVGVNAGLGYRWITDDGGIFGINGWYDNYQTEYNNRYSQITVGAEWLTEQFDLRGNAYLPIGTKRNVTQVLDYGTVPVFDGNLISFLGMNQEEQALRGVDAETGAPLLGLAWARAYAGAYYLESQDDDEILGFRGRIETALSPDVSLNFMVTNDNVFDTNLNLGIEWRFSGGLPYMTPQPFSTDIRKYAQVRRAWPVQTRMAKVDALIPSVNPRTGRPFRVAHVDNTNPTAGNGSSENPFRNLPMSAHNADMILVDAGMGDTLGNIVLEDYQRLLGEGATHTFYDARRGLTILPASFNRVGPVPTLRAGDPTQNVVTLANYNEVNTFDIIAGTAAGIGGSGITDFLVKNVDGAGAYGIKIHNASGHGVIRDSSFETTQTSAFVSNTSGAPLRLDVNNLYTKGGLTGLHVDAAGADAVVDIDFFVGDQHAETGMILEARLDSKLDAYIKDAFVLNTGNLTGGAFKVAASADGEVNAHFDGILGRGTKDLFVADVSEGTLNLMVDRAILNNSTTGSGVQMNLDDATGRTTFTTLQANRNGNNGFGADVVGGSQYVVDVIDSMLVANVDDATELNVAGGSDFIFNIDPTMAIESQNGSGLEFDVRDPGSMLVVNSTQTNFSMSGLHGIDGHIFNGASALLNVRQNAVDSNDGSGVHILADRSATLNALIVDSSFDTSVGSGLDITARDGSTANVRLDDISAVGNLADGLKVATQGGVSGPSLVNTVVTNSDFSNNSRSNIAGSSSGAGSVTSLDLNTIIADTGATMGGLALEAQAAGRVVSDWNFGTVASTLGDGVTAHADGAGSRIDMFFDTFATTTNLGDGIDGRITNGGVGTALNLTMVQSSISFNNGNGLDLDIAGGRGRVDLQGTPISNNFGDGIEFDVSAGGTLLTTASMIGVRGNIRDNGERGIQGTVTGAGSAALVRIEGLPILANQEGVLLSTTAGGALGYIMNGGSVSDSGLDGVHATSTGAGSLTSVDLNMTSLNHNGRLGAGDGFDATAMAGGRVLADLTGITATQNITNGFSLTANTGGRVDAAIFAPNAVRNGQSGLFFDVDSGGMLNGRFTNGNYTDSGTVVASSGVFGSVSGVGSNADVRFDGTISNSNPRHGFEFVADTGGTLLARLDTTGASNVLSAQDNGLSGTSLTVTGAGTSGNLLMGSPNLFNNNGQDGVTVVGTNATQVVTQISAAQIDGNGRDGVNINYNNVTMGAISITGDGAPSTISNNVDDGIEITLKDTMLTSKVVDNQVIPAFLIDGFNIENNGDEGLDLNIDNVDADPATISNLVILGGPNGIDVDLGNNNNWNLTIDSNQIDGVDMFGIRVQADGGNHNIAITNNTVRGSGDTNVFVDISGNATAGLNIDDNTIQGSGFGNPVFNIGLNFTGTTRLGAPVPGLTPPDTMGAVGPNHIVEMLNNGYAVYDKTTGAPLQSISLDQFWLAAGLPDIGTGTFDPRILYDPTVGRWFAASIDRGAANQIYVAVSNSSDPTGGWQAVRFVGDTVNGTRFNDFDTLGVDADGLYLATNNFGGAAGFDVSIYSIPKADLLLPMPSIANLTRFENLNTAQFGDTLQPAVDFGPSDGAAQFLSTESFAGGANLVRVDLTGTGGAGAMLGTPVDVPVPFYLPGPSARQPGAAGLENISPRFNGNVVEIGDSLWGVHAVQGSSGNSALRWYEIDANTNAVLQSGVIEDPNVDYIDGSIAVNPSGVVMIGFTGSGPSQFASAMAAFGTTNAMGATSFQAPQVLQAGVSNYFLDFGSGRNRWGDYSATVVDPTDPNKFWTFQEYAAGPQNFGVQITEVDFTQVSIGDTAHEGIRLTVRDTSHLTPSTINGNTVTDHATGAGILVQLSDTATVDDLDVDGNTVSNNDRGIIIETGSPNTVGGLSVSGNTVTDNTAEGLLVKLNDLNPAMVPDIHVDGNSVSNNGSGIDISVLDSSFGDLTAMGNSVSNNVAGNGISLLIDNSTAGVISGDSVNVSMNSVSGHQGDAVNLQINNISGLMSLDMSLSNLLNNLGGGLNVAVDTSPIGTITAANNTIVNNTGGDGILMDLVDSAVNQLAITGSNIESNAGDGINLDLDNSPIANLIIRDNDAGMAMPAGTLAFDFTNLIWTTFMDNNSSAGFDVASVTVDISPVGQGWRPDLNPFSPNGFQPQMGTDVTVGLDTVNGIAITPGTNPLQNAMGMVLPNGGVIPNSQVLTLTFDDFNPGERLEYDLAHTVLGSNSLQTGGTLAGSFITASLADGRSASGMLMGNLNDDINQMFPATVGGISSNTGGGVVINAQNGSNIGAMTVSGNLIDGNATHGLEIVADNSTLPSGAPGSTAQVTGNTISNHASGDAIRLVNPDTNGAVIAMDFKDNTLTDNGMLGLNLAFDNNSGGLTSTMSGNIVTGSGSHGAQITGMQNVTLDLTIGDDAAAQNMFNTNGGAGLVIDVTDNVKLPSPTIANSTFNGNASDGLRIARHGSAMVDNATIRTSTMSNNLGDGVDILAQSSNMTDEYTLTGNTISGNTARGLAMRAEADADIVANLDMNTISTNGADGVELTQLQGVGDTPSFTGTWTRNTISGNGGHGVEIAAIHNLVFGSNANPVPDTIISNNALTGILVNHPGGTLDLNNVQINGNGQQGILFNSNGNALNIDPSMVSNNGGNGLEINSMGAGATVNIAQTNFNGNNGSGVVVNAGGGPTAVTIDQATFNTNTADGLQVNANSGTTTVTATRSMFNGNQGDGLQVVNNAIGTTVSLSNNIEMRNNVRRGANILNRANGTATVSIDDAMIRQNGQEGVYVVNTASANQNADADATTALLANGSVFATPILDFTLTATNVLDNGLSSGFDGTGLVMRVGTSDGSTSVTDNGGFVSNGLGVLTGRGGVLAHVQNNTFGGNFGEDVIVESFVSTADPNITGGTWDAVTFNPTGYQSDPLARLDLYFEGNTGDSTDVTRTGAFYNTDEPVFKSRLTTQTPGGPFTSGTRDRNAQRQAFRGGAFAAPLVSPDLGTFLYPGVGVSTFRTSAASSTAGFTEPGTDSFIDMIPIPGAVVGELPFGWGTF